VILAKSDGRTLGELVIRQLGVDECCDVTACQLRVSCLATRAVALSPGGQHRQFREKRADRTVGRQARHK
jgi:hypothetical protein